MLVKLRSIGNSAGIIFPSSLLKSHNIRIGDILEANEVGDSIILSTVTKHIKYNLKDLVAMSKPAKLTEEDKEWLNMADAGKEKILNF